MNLTRREALGLQLATFGGARFLELLVGHLDRPGRLLTDPAPALAGIPGLTPRRLRSLLEARRSLDVDRHEAELARDGIGAVWIGEPGYPDALRQTPWPPLVLYHRGAVPDLSRAIALVGTRAASPYGLTMARRLAGDLAAAGAVVVSGMARGIDQAAHRGALDSGGVTVAVLGCGPDICYPPDGRRLFEAIPRQGAVVSELPPGMPPRPWTFPRRNRIIAGLSQGVVVVEAPARSGALITAHLALEAGREVYAVPGCVTDPRSAGGHRLLHDGAGLATDAASILGWSAGPGSGSNGPGRPGDTEVAPDSDEGRLLAVSDAGGSSLEELVVRTRLPLSRVMEALAGLCASGRLERAPGERFRPVGRFTRWLREGAAGPGEDRTPGSDPGLRMS